MLLLHVSLLADEFTTGVVATTVTRVVSEVFESRASVLSVGTPVVAGAVGDALKVGAGPGVGVVTGFAVGEAAAISAVGDAADALVVVCDATG